MPLKKTRNGNYEYVPFDTFKTSLDKTRAYEKEKEKWVNGWKGLTGRHYHFLTQGKVYSGVGGTPKFPKYRYDDRLVFELLTESDSTKEDVVLYSGRGIGKSVWLIEDTNYNANIQGGSTQAITACDLDRLKKYFFRLDKVSSDMDDAISPVISDISNKVGMPERTFNYVRKNKKGEEITFRSTIFGRQTSKTSSDVTNISGARGVRCTIEEPFLHPYLTGLLQSTEEITIENKVKIGYAFMAGTLEESSPNACLEELKKLIELQETLKMKVVFLPFHHGSYLNSDGTTNKEKAIEEWEKKCERLDKLEDKSFLRSYIKNNPLEIKHVLSLGDSGVIPPEAIAKIEDQKEEIRTTKIKIDQCIVKDKKIALSTAGKIKILQHPAKDGLYVMGTDPIEIENTASKQGSELVSWVVNYYTKQPVALYAERNFNTDIVVQNLIILGTMYNDAKNMIENNEGRVIIKEIKEKGFARLLSRQPKRTGLAVKETSGQIIYGVKMLGETVNYSHNLLVKYFLNYCDTVWFKELFDDLMKYPDGNTDYIRAFQCALIKIKDMDLGKKKDGKSEQKYREVPMLTRGADGRRYYITVKEPI